MKQLTLTHPKLYKLHLKEVIRFLKSPNLHVSSTPTTKSKVKDTIALLLLKIVIAYTVAIVVMQVFDPEKTGMKTMKEEFSLLVLLFFGGIIAPILEEAAFRLSLRFKPIYLSISGAFLFFYGISKFYFNTGYLNTDHQFLFRVVLSLIIGILLFVVSSKYVNSFKNFWHKNFRWIYYVSIILFGFVHITNYEMSTTNLLLMPLLTLPQSISGIFTGYVRIKYGFIYCCLFHCINNSFALLPTVLF